MADYRLTQSGDEVQSILNNSTPQSALAAETERAQGAEQTLQGNINTEAQARQESDTTLQGNINQVGNDLTAETNRATAAEKANADDIDVIEGKIPVAASDQNQLADKAFITEINVLSHDAAARKDREQYRDVKARSLFLSVCGGKVDLKIQRRKTVGAVYARRMNSVISLLDRKVGKSHHMKILQSAERVTFNAYDKSVNTEYSGSVDSSQHTLTPHYYIFSILSHFYTFYKYQKK